MILKKFNIIKRGKNTSTNFKNLKPNECKQIKGGNGGEGTPPPEEEEIDKKV